MFSKSKALFSRRVLDFFMLFLIEKPENKFRLVEAPIPEKSELLEIKVLVVGSIDLPKLLP